MLKGEVMGMREEESGPVSYLVGYFERDYGRSALYARKDVVIDASSLSSGIKVPAAPYWLDEIYSEYNIPFGVRNDFLAILLDRLEHYYELDDGFSEDFTADFEAFLGSVDSDDDTEGVQPYTDPSGNPILTPGDTLFFGPAVTWPKVLSNHPYIHFRHRLDRALLDAGVLGMGTEVLGDADWAAVFPSGPLNEGEDPEIIMTVETVPALGFPILEVDQVGTERPVNEFGSIGAIEATPTTTVTPTPRECALECRADQRDCRAPVREDQRECAAFCSTQRASDVESCAAPSDRERGQCRRGAAAAARVCLEICREAQQGALDSCQAVYETCRADCTDL